MIEIFDELNEDIYPVENITLNKVIDHMSKEGVRYCFVRHPRKTRTIAEKEALISKRENLYFLFPEIVVVKGSVLSYHDSDHNNIYVVHFNEGESKINFRKLKKKIGIPRKRDLHFYDGDLIELIGLDSGEVSPLMPTLEKISTVTFDSDLLQKGEKNPTPVFDLALTQELSLYANVNNVYNALCAIIGDKIKVVENTSVPLV